MCDTTLSCCTDKVFVQDIVCTNWLFTAAGTQTIYSDNISTIISGTGYVKYETGVGALTVNFFKVGIVAAIQTLAIPVGGSATFTVPLLTTITFTYTRKLYY
ncbi:DUF3992 domain-containing protein [Paenibacillus chondroitinus]|uniref:DUF3992 domain-containing protein n=1 Tax=Paenibacillus chondroitinus TaxID=59842 RepID=A0ABU6D9A5_9BACL|nr:MULTISPECIES: S-Ena type endospore appendage [Paenibacillus]MCY9656659.1 DUF3992 domain-containing protein [Paenibacillus anseongense]MEB4794308.1 DUF3992 domain-containing protein [Paenibacillus chondroitinus]